MTKEETLELAMNALANARDFISYHFELGTPPWDALDQQNECQHAIKAIKVALELPQEKYIYGTPLLDAMTKEKNT